MLHSLIEISNELLLAPFAMREFITSQTTLVLENTSLSNQNIDNELYLLIKRNKVMIEAIESYRNAELNFKITDLAKRLSMLEIDDDDDDYDFDGCATYLFAELNLAKGERLTREQEEYEVFFADEDVTDDITEAQSDDDEVNEDRYENEYSVYNNFGFVTWSFSLQDAQHLATQFNGYIKDKYGREVT